MFKFYKGLSPPITNNIFKVKTGNLQNLRKVFQFFRSNVKTVYHRAESISYLRPKIWSVLPVE